MTGEGRRAGGKGRPKRVEGALPTKDRIFEAAVDLFSRQGYDRTTMRQLADAVGLTESAVYRHYTGKCDVLTAILSYAQEKAFSPLPGQPPSQGRASIFRSLLLAPLKAMGDDPYLGRIMKIMYARMLHDRGLRDYFQREYVERADELLERLFKGGIDSGALRPCDARGLAVLFNAFRSDWAFRTFILADEGALDLERATEALGPAIRILEAQFAVAEP